jgi:hypothetical protein
MQRDMFGAEEGEDEQIKHMLIDNPPWLLALTFGISTIHMILDFLAFKNGVYLTPTPTRKLMVGSFRRYLLLEE